MSSLFSRRTLNVEGEQADQPQNFGRNMTYVVRVGPSVRRGFKGSLLKG